MKKLVFSIVAAVLTVVGLGGIAMMSPVHAVGTDNPAFDFIGGENGSGDPTNDIRPDGVKNTELMTTIKRVINTVIGIIGMLAVIMIIMGGINFVTSQGDTAKVAKARNTILYGVVGLVVALLAFAIVNFVLSNVFKSA